jgi:hypothetical protein
MMGLLFIIAFQPSFTQNIFPPEYRQCIVELDVMRENGIFEPHGTGFAIYDYTSPGFYYIVTCEHILRNTTIWVKVPVTDSAAFFFKANKIDSVLAGGRLWLFDGYSLKTEYSLLLGRTFAADKALDIGIINLAVPGEAHFGDRSIRALSFKGLGRSLSKRQAQIEIGLPVCFIGFPFSIGSTFGYMGTGRFASKSFNPVLRTGVVAWKDNENHNFLVDGVSYGGNSGSPLFTQIDPFSSQPPALIGMVQGHEGERKSLVEVKIDQNGNPMKNPDGSLLISVAEGDFNIGLARCVWIDQIFEIIDKSNSIFHPIEKAK